MKKVLQPRALISGYGTSDGNWSYAGRVANFTFILAVILTMR